MVLVSKIQTKKELKWRIAVVGTETLRTWNTNPTTVVTERITRVANMKEGPLLNSTHIRTCAWMTLSISRFLFVKHDFATGNGNFCWRNSSLVCSASWEKDYELLQLQTCSLQVTRILREALRSWTFLPLRSLIGFKAYLTVSCVTIEWKILIGSSHLGRLWLSLRICGTLLQEFFSPAYWTSSFIWFICSNCMLLKKKLD